MFQGWPGLSEAEQAAWTRTPSADALWSFGALGLVILIGLMVFAWGGARRRRIGIAAGMILALPCAALAAEFLHSAIQARRAHARCLSDGGALEAGRLACSPAGAAVLAHLAADEDGFPRLQYYWTDEGLCLADVGRLCRVETRPVDSAPTPGLENRDRFRTN